MNTHGKVSSTSSSITYNRVEFLTTISLQSTKTLILLERLEQMNSNFGLLLSWFLSRSLCSRVPCQYSPWMVLSHIKSSFGQGLTWERYKLVKTVSTPFDNFCIFLQESEDNSGCKDTQEVSAPVSFPGRVICEVRPACSWTC